MRDDIYTYNSFSQSMGSLSLAIYMQTKNQWKIVGIFILKDALVKFVYAMLIPTLILFQSIIIEANRRKSARPIRSVFQKD